MVSEQKQALGKEKTNQTNKQTKHKNQNQPNLKKITKHQKQQQQKNPQSNKTHHHTANNILVNVFCSVVPAALIVHCHGKLIKFFCLWPFGKAATPGPDLALRPAPVLDGIAFSQTGGF